jgi:hypothetical protein
MTQDSERSTPPRQTTDDPNTADRRLSDEQKRTMKDEPAPPTGKGDSLPDPNAVGEDG